MRTLSSSLTTVKTHVVRLAGRTGYGKTVSAARLDAQLQDRLRDLAAERASLIRIARENPLAFTRHDPAVARRPAKRQRKSS
jgi:hypothetical protein